MRLPRFLLRLLVLFAASSLRADALQLDLRLPVYYYCTVSPAQEFVVEGRASANFYPREIRRLTLVVGGEAAASVDTAAPEVAFRLSFEPQALGTFSVVLKATIEDGTIEERSIAELTVASAPPILRAPRRGGIFSVGQIVSAELDPNGNTLNSAALRAFQKLHFPFQPNGYNLGPFAQGSEWSMNADREVSISLSEPGFRGAWIPDRAGSYMLYGFARNQGAGRWDTTPPIEVTVLPVGRPEVILPSGSIFGSLDAFIGLPLAAGSSTTLNLPRPLSHSPVAYQWLRNGLEIPGATEPDLSISGATEMDLGKYWLRMANHAGVILVPVKEIIPTVAPSAHGTVLFDSSIVGDVPAATYNGQPLDASHRARLFAGPSMFEMTEQGPAVRFSGGRFAGGTVALTNVPPGADAYVQIRAWPAGGVNGVGTFEQAQRESYYGVSKMIKVRTGIDMASAAPLTGLEPFQLIIWDGYMLMPQFPQAVREVTPGSSLALTAGGYGQYTWTGVRNNNLSFQWRVNGRILPETTSILTISDAQAASVGFYQVAITDGVGLAIGTSYLSLINQGGLSARSVATASGLMLELAVSGRAGSSVEIQRATVLGEWSNWRRVDLTGTSALVSEPPRIEGEQFFVRAAPAP